MIPYWLQLVAGTGATAIIVYGSIFKLPRNWLKNKHKFIDELLSCSMCVGFWVGFVMSHLLNVTYTQHIIIGLAISACSWLYDSVVGACQSVDVYLDKKNK